MTKLHRISLSHVQTAGKGTPKGTCTLNVKVTAAAKGNCKMTIETVALKVRVR